MKFVDRDLTDIHSITRDEIEYVISKAALIKRAIAEKDLDAYRLAGDRDLIVSLLFYENSTRTRSSFEIAAMRMGLSVTGFTGVEGTSVQKGESLRHTLDMFEAYRCDAVILRHPLDGSARFAADHVKVPVFNAGDGKHEHPTQTLLDLFTIYEHLKKLDGISVGMGGDLKYGRTVHSLAIALSLFNDVELHLYSHPSLRMPQPIIDLVTAGGVSVTVHENMNDLLPEVDIFYSTRIQKERMPDPLEYERAKDAGRFKAAMMKNTRDSFGLMHPLPMNKEAPSIDPGLDCHPKSIFKAQAGNGVPTRLVELALSLGLMGDDFQGQMYEDPVELEEFYDELEIMHKPYKTEQAIRPIRDGEGVVIDHLKPYSEEILTRLLHTRERSSIYRAGTVRSHKVPARIKGLLMIEDRELDEQEMRLVSTVSPGCRINFIRKGKVARKLQMRLPHRIQGLHDLLCPNTGCITRPEHHERVSPVMIRVDEENVRCYYCDTVMQSGKAF